MTALLSLPLLPSTSIAIILLPVIIVGWWVWENITADEED